MISSLLLEAAIRSVLLAAAVWIGLRLFSVRNVLAQKIAWGLVLASALAMPVVLPMAAHWSVLPANVRVVIPADPQTLLEELQARIQAKTSPEQKPSAEAALPAEPSASQGTSTDEPLMTDTSASHTAAPFEKDLSSLETESPVASQPAPQSVEIPPYAAAMQQPSAQHPAAQHPAAQHRARISLLASMLLLYGAVAVALLSRLAIGLFSALRLWYSATPISLETIQTSLPHPDPDFFQNVRHSRAVPSPVTIGSGIVLPANYSTWDSEKLRVVIAHERSHVRQGDFYLQLLAGSYSAVVWFSPLGWWLKRKLSDLAEAISDRAGLEQAADPASYAQILLEFAAAPRPTLIGVAMARSGSLSRRIERLLNEVSFRQAFAGTRRGLAAVIVVPVALFAATALVRVEAASQQNQEQAQAVLPTTGVVTPQEPQAAPAAQPGVPSVVPDGGEAPEPEVVPQIVPDHAVAPKAPADCGPAHIAAPPAPAHAPGIPAIAPVPPAPGHVMILSGKQGIATLAISPRVNLRTPVIVLPNIAYTPAHTTLAVMAPSHMSFGEGRGYGVGQSTTTTNGSMTYTTGGKHSGTHYWYSSNGDSYAIIHGNNADRNHAMFSGNWTEGRHEEMEKARKQAGGKDILWFTRDSKSYYLDDPATLAQIDAMYKPMEDLSRQQEELGKKQEALGKQQEALGHQQEQASVPTPDMSKEIAQIEEAMAKLKANQGKNMTQEQFGELQEKLGDLQGRLGEIQGEIGSKQGEFGEKMGELGSKMGELGEQMGRLGEQQGKIAEQADQKIKSIIDQSLKNGQAHPVQ